jgi:hypothetical protein
MMGYATGLTAQIMRAMAAHPDRARCRARRSAVAPWKPYVAPVRPPGGTYDPTLDANLRGAQRGYGDTKADASLANSRGLQDALIHIAAGRKARDEANSDDLTGFHRLQSDVGTARTHMWQDFATDKADRTRNYAQLGERQGEQASLQGVSQGGTLAASLAARAANQGREQQAADTSFTRGNEGLDQQLQRGGEDLFRTVGRRNTAQDVDEATTGTTLQRAVDDRGTTTASWPRAHQLHAGHGRVAVLPGVAVRALAGAAAPGQRARLGQGRVPRRHSRWAPGEGQPGRPRHREGVGHEQGAAAAESAAGSERRRVCGSGRRRRRSRARWTTR